MSEMELALGLAGCHCFCHNPPFAVVLTLWDVAICSNLAGTSSQFEVIARIFSINWIVFLWKGLNSVLLKLHHLGIIFLSIYITSHTGNHWPWTKSRFSGNTLFLWLWWKMSGNEELIKTVPINFVSVVCLWVCLFNYHDCFQLLLLFPLPIRCSALQALIVCWSLRLLLILIDIHDSIHSLRKTKWMNEC